VIWGAFGLGLSPNPGRIHLNHMTTNLYTKCMREFWFVFQMGGWRAHNHPTV
jgi:hypothetical protein